MEDKEPIVFNLTQDMLNEVPFKSLRVMLKYIDDISKSPDVEALIEGNYAAGTRLRSLVKELGPLSKQLDQEVRALMHKAKTASPSSRQLFEAQENDYVE